MRSEILAPAGSFESLQAAVNSGADAVYLGFSDFSARASAKNFDFSNFEKAVTYAYTRGVEIYVALNTIIVSKSEMQKALEIASFALSCGVCDFIVQDLGLARLMSALSDRVRLHASTQTALTTASAANFLKPVGFMRYVLPRELTLSEIESYSKSTDGQTEAFIHGAHCFSVSGQCYMSAFCGGRSGNRGSCAQPCRQPFSGDYPLSLSDLSFIDYKDELIKADVCSFKIEGRLKRPEYVAAAVLAVKEGKRTKILSDIFSRGEHTDGFLTGKRDFSMYGVREKGDVLRSNSALERFEMPPEKKVPLDITVSVLKDKFYAQFKSGDVSIEVEGEKPSIAKNLPLSIETLKESLSKLGDSPFFINSFSAEIGDELFLPKSAINALRREGCDRLVQKMLPKAIETIPQSLTYKERKKRKNQKLFGVFESASQISDKIYSQFEKVFLPSEEIKKLPSKYSEKANSYLPVSFDEKREVLGEAPLCTAIDGIAAAKSAGKSPIADFSANITNAEAAKTMQTLGVSAVVISPECSVSEVKFFPEDISVGITAYGKMPLMKSRVSPKNKTDKSYLTDKIGERFFITKSGDIWTIHSSRPVYLGDKKSELAYIDFFTLRFTDEKADEIEEVIELFQSGGEYKKPFTRAFYFKR